MRITKIRVNNFKSLVDFEIDLAKFSNFNCIVGLNGAGKSTFLQLIDFLSQLMKGDMVGWLKSRGWGKDDYLTWNHDTINIGFTISFSTENQPDCYWQGTYSCRLLRCLNEEIKIGNRIFSVDNPGTITNRNSYTIDKQKRKPINFRYQGSILSQLDDDDLPKEYGVIQRAFADIRSFDLLSPSHIKQGMGRDESTIGREGENLAGYVHQHQEKKSFIEEKVKLLYPQFDSLATMKLDDERKVLLVNERTPEGKMQFLTRTAHINDGLMRVIGVFAAMTEPTFFLLFDEIENGINQELVELLLNELLNAQQQIVVTTHSPLFLNYLDDDLARDCVQYFYKTPEGFTRCRKFFSIPSTAKKLGSLAPGEAIADTNLYRLNEEIEQLDRNEKED